MTCELPSHTCCSESEHDDPVRFSGRAGSQVRSVLLKDVCRNIEECEGVDFSQSTSHVMDLHLLTSQSPLPVCQALFCWSVKPLSVICSTTCHFDHSFSVMKGDRASKGVEKERNTQAAHGKGERPRFLTCGLNSRLSPRLLAVHMHGPLIPDNASHRCIAADVKLEGGCDGSVIWTFLPLFLGS